MPVKLNDNNLLKFFILLLAFFGAFATVNYEPSDVLGDKEGFYLVTKVVDGDTIVVTQEAKEYKVRLLGIDTPETVDPQKQVECFGLEASNKAKELLEGKYVRLEDDPTQLDKDRYGRLLRYVYLEDGTFINKYMVAYGYANEYTYQTPYEFQNDFRFAQQQARDASLGLWGDICN